MELVGMVVRDWRGDGEGDRLIDVVTGTLTGVAPVILAGAAA